MGFLIALSLRRVLRPAKPLVHCRGQPRFFFRSCARHRGGTTDDELDQPSPQLADEEGGTESSRHATRRAARQPKPATVTRMAAAAAAAGSDDDATHSSSAWQQESGAVCSAGAASPPVSVLEALRLTLGLGGGGGEQRLPSAPSSAMALALPPVGGGGGGGACTGATAADSAEHASCDGGDPVLDSILAELLEDEDLQSTLQPGLLSSLASDACASDARASGEGLRLGAFLPLPHVPPPPALEGDALVDDVLTEVLLEELQLPLSPAGTAGGGADAAGAPSALASAWAMVSAGRGPVAPPLVPYTSPDATVRVALKVFNW